jgi:predicted pore-forming effector associated with SMODS systems
MNNVREHALLWARIVSLVAIWAAILYTTGTGLSINMEAVKKLPDVVTVYVILSFVFTKWIWRAYMFSGWLVPFPDLEGTWQGELHSTWTSAPGAQALPSVPVILVIRQTFSSISCVLYTPESESYSTVAQMDEISGVVRLHYNYTNRPMATIRDRSTMHEGAASLRVITRPERSLEGEYWASRCTAGDIKLKYRSRKLAEHFPESEVVT